MSGTTINPYRFGGQVGYRTDSVNRQYVRERHLDSARGRWLTPDPEGSGGGENPYCYALASPVNTADPSGLAPRRSGHVRRVATPGCPHSGAIPNDGDYAIACSRYAASHISASFTLPTLCNVRNTFINFYLSMGGFEAGISFSPRRKGWNAFFNAQGSQQNAGTSLSPGQTVSMSLTRQRSGVVQFVINGQKLDSPRRLSKVVQVKLVNAAGLDPNCPNTHSAAAWSLISVDGGMQVKAVFQGDEQVISNLFSSRLRQATLPCDSSQYPK